MNAHRCLTGMMAVLLFGSVMANGQKKTSAPAPARPAAPAAKSAAPAASHAGGAGGAARGPTTAGSGTNAAAVRVPQYLERRPTPAADVTIRPRVPSVIADDVAHGDQVGQSISRSRPAATTPGPDVRRSANRSARTHLRDPPTGWFAQFGRLARHVPRAGRSRRDARPSPPAPTSGRWPVDPRCDVGLQLQAQRRVRGRARRHDGRNETLGHAVSRSGVGSHRVRWHPRPGGHDVRVPRGRGHAR